MSPVPTDPARTRRPGMRRSLLAGGLAAATALAGTTLAGTALALGAAQASSATYDTSYTCTSSLRQIKQFNFPMKATVSARLANGVTGVEVPGGSPVLSEDTTLNNLAFTSTLDARVDGSAVQLRSSGTISIKPNQPVPLPTLVGTTRTATGPTLAFVPGKLVMVLRVSGITVTLTCNLNGTAPTVTVPVAGVATPTPTLTPTPTPTPTSVPARPSATTTPSPSAKPTASVTPSATTTTPGVTATPSVTPPTAPTAAPVPPMLHSPRMGAKLDRKTHRKKKRATVVVTLRPSRDGVVPAGKVKVTVGKRTVRTVNVSVTKARKAGAKGHKVKVTLPKNLKPGKRTVKVRVTWKDKQLHGTAEKKLKVRVKR